MKTTKKTPKHKSHNAIKKKISKSFDSQAQVLMPVRLTGKNNEMSPETFKSSIMTLTHRRWTSIVK